MQKLAFVSDGRDILPQRALRDAVTRCTGQQAVFASVY
jgi:hypothetical protein